MMERAVWGMAALGLLAPLLVAVWLCGRGDAGQRLAGAQIAASLATALLVVLSFALDLPSGVDLALTLALLGIAGGLLYAHFLERWL